MSATRNRQFHLDQSPIALYVFGQEYTLSGQRLETENPDCVREARWLGLVLGAPFSLLRAR